MLQKKREGGQPVDNYIPRLTELAEDNISFSDGDLLGGWQKTDGDGWTMGSLFTQMGGIPWAFPVEANSMGDHTKIASGLTTLGDLLKQDGYRQIFLCGSDGSFAGRADFFQQHGEYEIHDHGYAMSKGYIPDGYNVWWGYEDEYLFEIAKRELLELSSEGQTFNYTMLTVDTHHIGGYICDLCGNEYDEPLANVIACCDRQVAEFVEWCKNQDFYENTVIVICGDHPRMDTILVDGASEDDRTIYNCFLNAVSAEQALPHQKNRDFMAMDMMPTVLAALGFDIEGDRLGLGTNLFSGRKTLAEELGVEELKSELSKYSQYYVEHFY